MVKWVGMTPRILMTKLFILALLIVIAAQMTTPVLAGKYLGSASLSSNSTNVHHGEGVTATVTWCVDSSKVVELKVTLKHNKRLAQDPVIDWQRFRVQGCTACYFEFTPSDFKSNGDMRIYAQLEAFDAKGNRIDKYQTYNIWIRIS